MFARSRTRRNKQKVQKEKSPKPRRRQAKHDARGSTRPKHRNVARRVDGYNHGSNDGAGNSTNHYDVQEATDFIKEFDKTLEQLEDVEKRLSWNHRPSQVVNARDDLDKLLGIKEMTKKQKQALLLLLLCCDADIPASVFRNLSKSETMCKIMDELLHGENVTDFLSCLV
eukprot:gene20361-22369_t